MYWFFWFPSFAFPPPFRPPIPSAQGNWLVGSFYLERIRYQLDRVNTLVFMISPIATILLPYFFLRLKIPTFVMLPRRGTNSYVLFALAQLHKCLLLFWLSWWCSCGARYTPGCAPPIAHPGKLGHPGRSAVRLIATPNCGGGGSIFLIINIWIVPHVCINTHPWLLTLPSLDCLLSILFNIYFFISPPSPPNAGLQWRWLWTIWPQPLWLPPTPRSGRWDIIIYDILYDIMIAMRNK